VRNSLNAGLCDVIPGVAHGMEMLRTTQPYYASAYAFVSRVDRALDLRSLDDARLRTLRIGVQLIGEGTDVSPPAYALARRGVVANVRGYLVAADYNEPNPPARAVDAVARGDVDVAVVWGPLAGAWAKRSPVPLRVTLIAPSSADAGLPLRFEISMGVRRKDTALARELDAVLSAEGPAIRAILDDVGVPLSALPLQGGDRLR
jgi:mxaJ protein